MAKCLLIGLLTAGLICAAVSPDYLIRKSLDNFKVDHSAAPHYTYMERDAEKNDGTTKVSVSKIFAVNGFPYEMTVSRNGVPLTGDQLVREKAKLQKRENESATERTKRAHDYQNSTRYLDDVPNALAFTIAGEEMVNGRANYVLKCRPKPGYQPHDTRSAMFAHIEATLWIDKEDVRWTMAKAKVLDTISIGWVLARIEPGAAIELDQTPVGNQHWLPSMIDVNGDARVLLVKDHPIHEHITFYDFRPAESSGGSKGQPVTK